MPVSINAADAIKKSFKTKVLSALSGAPGHFVPEFLFHRLRSMVFPFCLGAFILFPFAFYLKNRYCSAVFNAYY